MSLEDCEEDLEAVSALQALSPVLKSLSVSTSGSREAFSEALKPLVNLESLQVELAGYPKLPGTLQALTSITIAASDIPGRGVVYCTGATTSGSSAYSSEDACDDDGDDSSDVECCSDGGSSDMAMDATATCSEHATENHNGSDGAVDEGMHGDDASVMEEAGEYVCDTHACGMDMHVKHACSEEGLAEGSGDSSAGVRSLAACYCEFHSCR